MKKTNIISQISNAAIFILLEIAALNMLANNSTLQGIWISKGAHAVMGSIWGGTQNLKEYFSLRSRNDELALENHQLRLRMAQMRSAMPLEDSFTSGPLKSTAGCYRFTPASITKAGKRSQHNYMIIDKGYEDGVTEGAGIITGKGAIGIVDAVSRKYSYARSFQNHEMNISARLGRKGNVGPLSWDGIRNNGAVLREIPHHIRFSPGDTVYTSGYSSIFPPDIPLGTVKDARMVNGATYEMSVELFEDFGALRYVTIVDNVDKAEIEKLEESR